MSEEASVVVERVYTIPLGKIRDVPRSKRAPRAVREVRRFIWRHFLRVCREKLGKELELENVKIDPEVNEYIWSRSIEKPPRRVRVKASLLSDGTVYVELFKGGEEKKEVGEKKAEAAAGAGTEQK